ncbi:uncharacterized protein LOC127733940 [Mytilus californianus]|uniref:uncharacterized protein LOC127733940 n=1 Tax=Mytilus californianus TaxID=6549 RepID=UPI0022464D25|nr:uncharacterized protein LOC127733940 [Mytilus californianus]
MEVYYPQDFLKCGVCNKQYTNPEQLSCFHSFCAACINQLEDQDSGVVICPKCEFEGPSQKQSDEVIGVLLGILKGDVELCGEHHDQPYTSFCQICECVLCDECRTDKHKGCSSVVTVHDDNIDEIVNSFGAEVEKELAKSTRNVTDSYTKFLKQQQRLFKEKCGISTTISAFYYNLKTKILEYLIEQENMFQNYVRKHYSTIEQKLEKNIKQSECISQRFASHADLFSVIDKAPSNISNLHLYESVKKEVSKSKSEITKTDKCDTVEFIPEESQLKKVFDFQLANLRLAGETVITESNRTSNLYNIDELLVYPALPLNTEHSTSNETTVNYLNTNEARPLDLDENLPTGSSELHVSVPQLPTSQLIGPPIPEPSTSIDTSVDTYETETEDTGNNPSTLFCESDIATPGLTSQPTAPPIPDNINPYSCEVVDNRYSTTNPSRGSIETTCVYEYGDFVQQFKSQFAEEPKSGSAVGMTWVGDDRILMVDRWNHKLKLFTEKGALVSTTVVPEGEPWDIAYINNTNLSNRHMCAVTLPTTKRIMFVRIIDKIEVSRSIMTRCGYCCLAHDKNGHTLVCGTCRPFINVPSIHIINSQGIVQKEFALDGMGNPLFDYPRSVDVTEDGEIIVCDWKKKRLLFMKTDGFILGDYRGALDYPLKEPIGTTLDGLGNVLVTDTKANRIQAISVKDRQFVTALKLDKDLYHPREITLVKKSNYYPKIAVATDMNVVIFDLWSPVSPEEPSAPPINPSAPPSTVF